ncbi:MAG: hypothetical protein Q4Q04_06360 [Methanocorpusculum sp.]|nr:hypothetical protein [Methanocorpusculum sp.]
MPDGKYLAVGHKTKDGRWVNCPVTLREDGTYDVQYTGLSPFAALFVDNGTENPLTAQTTDVPNPPKSPAPVFAIPAGLIGAAVVLRMRR